MLLCLRRGLPIIILFISLWCFGQKEIPVLYVRGLRCNGQSAPQSIDNAHPRLSWKISGNHPNILQTAFELVVCDSNEIIWRTGKVKSDVSTGIAYIGPVLRSGGVYRYRVRVRDNHGHVSAWSNRATFRMGLLALNDWKAKWISPSFTEDTAKRVPPVFVRHAMLVQRVRSAFLFITAHGLYEATINRQRVGNAFFTPGWTSYDHRLQYQVYDVKNTLHQGDNGIAVTVGDGWWRGVFGGDMSRDHYGNDASLLFQLVVEYEDGKKEMFVSDSSWRCRTGAIRYADLYNGEIYDARLEKGKEETAVKVRDIARDDAALIATIAPPVVRQESFTPVRVFTDPKGELVFDLGQNISGWVRCRIKGKRGDTVRISHAEALDKEGNFYTGNLREAKAQEIYVLRGDGTEIFEPHFTYHGFRYVRVEGIKGPLLAKDFTGVALYSDLAKAGNFLCSDHRLNQLQHNIIWSQKDNFFDIPTDCPQRSERYGWTGDAQIFARTASYNRDVSAFFLKWLKDLAADQDSLGGLPVIIPDLYGHRSLGPKRAVAGWGDAATIVPWTMFQVYGDTSILRTQYASMRAWVEHIRRLSPDDFWNGTGYGDWLSPDTVVLTPTAFIAQCYFAASTHILAESAGILGLIADSIRYAGLLARIKSAFLRVYTPMPATQTACVLALSFDLLPDSLRSVVGRQLTELVHSHGDHLSTGFLGTPHLLPVLSSIGQTDLAYKVLLQETLPGWLYPITKGATTIWEKWDAIAPDGTVGEKSLNHYSHGAVGDWLYRQVAGITEAAPGYKKIRIAPHPGGGLTWVKASYECPYGRIVSNWRSANGKFYLHVEIPANTSAEVLLPGATAPIVVGSGSYDYIFALGLSSATGALLSVNSSKAIE